MVSRMLSFIIIKKIKVFHVIVAQPLLLILIANVSYSHANYTVCATVPLKEIWNQIKDMQEQESFHLPHKRKASIQSY